MGGKGKAKAHEQDDGEHDCCDHGEGEKRKKGKRRARNAYETVPKRGGGSTVTEEVKS